MIVFTVFTNQSYKKFNSYKNMASRDEILMNFMAATGSEDFGKAFQLLESTDWNFENALGLFHATDDDHPDPNKILESQLSVSQLTSNQLVEHFRDQ